MTRLWAALFLAGLASQRLQAATPVGLPDWLRDSIATPHKSFDPRVPAVVLLDEGQLTVGEDGRTRLSVRRAIEVLTREGRDWAAVQAFYSTDLSRVVEIHGWLRDASGRVHSYDKKDALDVAVVGNDLYSESRYKLLNARDLAEPGAVFGYEYEIEERPGFRQRQWWFQDRLPSLRSTLRAALPPGWRIEGRFLGGGPAPATSSSVWELRDLGYLPPEPASPSLPILAPRLALSYYPPPAVRVEGQSFSSWPEVAAWMHELSDAQAALSPALTAKATELTQGARTEGERIGAIARYVQSLPYVSVQIGVGRFRPHTASEVLAKAYGDCKDKANLMRALLSAIGIEAQLVLAYSGDRDYVQESWPSPTQFNHCILAIRVRTGKEGAWGLLAQAGPLLFFDPTDADTSLGDLPEHEQGAFGLLVAREGGALVRLPAGTPDSSRIQREIKATIDPDGSIRATIHEIAYGQAAARLRRWVRWSPGSALLSSVERWLASATTGVTVASVVPTTQSQLDRSEVAIELASPRYAKLIQGRLLVLRPALASRRDTVLLDDPDRQLPLNLTSEAYVEKAEFELPAGFEVDELPERVRLDTPHGRFRTDYSVENGRLFFSRELWVPRVVVPAGQYAAARSFFGKVAATEQAVVVLAHR